MHEPRVDRASPSEGDRELRSTVDLEDTESLETVDL